MVERSLPAGFAPSRVVALWKDPTGGIREIAARTGGARRAAVDVGRPRHPAHRRRPLAGRRHHAASRRRRAPGPGDGTAGRGGARARLPTAARCGRRARRVRAHRAGVVGRGRCRGRHRRTSSPRSRPTPRRARPGATSSAWRRVAGARRGARAAVRRWRAAGGPADAARRRVRRARRAGAAIGERPIRPGRRRADRSANLRVSGGPRGDRRRHRGPRGAARPARRRRRRDRPRARCSPSATRSACRATAEQRKLVTVLFSDLVDFTVLSQPLDAEDVRNVIDAYFVRWHAHIEANGGVVEKFIGDAVMAVFGIHAGEEDAPNRAIRAALAMRDRARRAQRPRSAAEHGITLQMRVGIDTGDVVVSTLGDRPGQEFVVVGEVVNRASRLQSAAPPGGVLISADTLPPRSRRVRRAAGARAAAEGDRRAGRRLPRRGRPRARLSPRRTSRGIEGVETRTVGRELELRATAGTLPARSPRSGQWQVVTVVGDAGVGKSRLRVRLRRLARRARPSRCGGSADGRPTPAATLPFALLHDLFATRFDITTATTRSRFGASGSAGSSRRSVRATRPSSRAHTIALWLGFEIGETRRRSRRATRRA